MKKSIMLALCYTIAMILGGVITYMVKSYHPKKIKKNIVPDYVYMGSKEEQLDFVEYTKGLYFSDSTVLKHKEGMLATPKVVSEVALAIFEDYYWHDVVEFNYPYYITKAMYVWNVEGYCTYSIDDGYWMWDAALTVHLTRSNGMITGLVKGL